MAHRGSNGEQRRAPTNVAEGESLDPLGALATLAAATLRASQSLRLRIGGQRTVAVVDEGAPIPVRTDASPLAAEVLARRDTARPLVVADLAASPYADDPALTGAAGARWLALVVASDVQGGVHAVGAMADAPRGERSTDPSQLAALQTLLRAVGGAPTAGGRTIDAYERRVREAAALSLALRDDEDLGSALAAGFERLRLVAEADVGVVLMVRAGAVTFERTAGLPPAEAGAVLGATPGTTAAELDALVGASGQRLPPTLLGLDDVATLIGVPVRDPHSGRLLAVLALGARHGGDGLGRSAFLLARAFARQLAQIHGRLAGEAERERLREASLSNYAALLERGGYEDAGHTARVTRAAERFADALGLDADARRDLVWGARLHDVGMLAVSLDLLRRPRLLTSAERESVEAHAEAGVDMIASLPFLPAGLRAVVRHHHERWDGTGYPHGLAGDAIPIAARAFAVIDAYDALTRRRPFRDAWSHEAARTWLREQSGAAFDPWLTEVFLTAGIVETLA